MEKSKALKAPAPAKKRGASVRKASPAPPVKKVMKKMAAPAPAPTFKPRVQAKKAVDPEQEKFKEQIKMKASELRKIEDEEESLVLELGLVIDATGSMSRWIARAQETLIEIIDKVVTDCEEEGKLQVRITCVAYRDLSDSVRFQVFPFSSDVEAAKTFIKSLRADGGADHPEDVCGGLKLALMQDWTVDGNKKLFMIADAPCHGREYNKGGDSYPDGTPDAPDLKTIMDEFREKEIDFNLIKLDHSMDLMAADMHKFYGTEEEGFDMKDMAPQRITDLETGIARIETDAEVTTKFMRHAVESTTATVKCKVMKKKMK